MKLISFLLFKKIILKFVLSLLLMLTLLFAESNEQQQQQQQIRIECNKPDRKLKHQIFTLNKTERSLNLQNSTQFKKQCELKYTGSRYLRSYDANDQEHFLSASQVFLKSKRIKYNLNSPQNADEYDNLLSNERDPNPLDSYNSNDSPFQFLSGNMSNLMPSLTLNPSTTTTESQTSSTSTTTTTSTTSSPSSTMPIQSGFEDFGSFFANISPIDLEIHVFDFYMISGDIYINLNILANELEKTPNAKRDRHKRLIINLVSRQFVTFRLINFHLAHQAYEEVLILLAGQSNLHVSDKAYGSIMRVFNAPVYTDRHKWFPYLIQMFGNQTSEYYEHLNKFCQISHLKIDIVQPIIVQTMTSDQLSRQTDEYGSENDTYIADLNVDFYELIEFDYNKMDSDVTLLKSCLIERVQIEPSENDTFDLNETYLFTEEEVIRINQRNIYLFEVEQKGNNNNLLRLYVKDCTAKDEYFLIFYVFNYNQNQTQLKRIVLEDSNCKLFVLSNAQVVDVYDNKYQNYKHFDGFKIDARHSNASNMLRESIGKLVYSELEATLFFYLKLKSDADEVEFHFMEPHMESAQDMVSNKFFNRINHQLFSELYQKEVSMRFVLSKNDLLDYFHRSNLNLFEYLDVHNQNELEEHRRRLHQFYVGSEQCPALFLNTNITNLNDDIYILLFNSNMYKQTVTKSEYKQPYISWFNNQLECFYFDGQSVHSIFFFHLDHGEYKESIYFNLNQPVNRIKYNNEQQIEPVENYLNQLINYVLNSNYLSEITENTNNLLVNTNTNTTQTIEQRVHIELNLVDYFFKWELNSCWLSDNECSSLNEQNRHDDNEDDSDYDQTTNKVNKVKRQSGLDQIQRVQVNTDIDYGDYDDFEPTMNTSEQHHMAKQSNTSTHKPNLHQVELLKIDWQLASSQFENNQVLNLDGHLKLIDFSNANNKKYLLCSMKPVSNCKPNEQCRWNFPLENYFKMLDNRRTPMKTIKLVRFDYEAERVDLKHTINPCSNQFKLSSGLKPNDQNNRTIDPNESEEEQSTVFFWNDVNAWLVNNKITLILIAVLIVLLVITFVLIRIITGNNCINLELPHSETTDPNNKYGVNLSSSENHELQVKLLNDRNKMLTGHRNAQLSMNQRQCSNVTLYEPW